jgi:hypothetical protein
VLNWLWLALANHHLGKPEEARRWLGKAQAWLSQFGDGLPSRAEELGLDLHNWLEAHVLRREAERLLPACQVDLPGGSVVPCFQVGFALRGKWPAAGVGAGFAAGEGDRAPFPVGSMALVLGDVGEDRGLPVARVLTTGLGAGELVDENTIQRETPMPYRAIETGGALIRFAESGAGEQAFVFLHYWGGSGQNIVIVGGAFPGLL